MELSHLVVFDFDWSLVNENTDTFVLELVPGLSAHMNDVRKSNNTEYGFGKWTALMDYIVGKMMRDYNISIDDISSKLRNIPYFIEMFNAAKFAKESGAELIILSDANTFYINEILSQHNIKDLFSQIITNYAHIDEENILRILPYHQTSLPPHNCTHCPLNLCKGRVLNELKIKYNPKSIIYIGDGGGDLCPCLSLTPSDSICCRLGWTLHKQLSLAGETVKATVCPWENGNDVLNSFYKLLK